MNHGQLQNEEKALQFQVSLYGRKDVCWILICCVLTDKKVHYYGKKLQYFFLIHSESEYHYHANLIFAGLCQTVPELWFAIVLHKILLDL